MKKFFLFLFMAAMVAQVNAQESYKKRRTLGLSLILNDFQTASDIRSLGLARVIKDNKYFSDGRMNPGLGIDYLEGISKHLDFKASLAGSFGDYPVPNKPVVNNRPFLLEATATVNAKLLSDKYWLTPYFNFGVGASKVKGYYAAFIPAGLGLQFNMFDEAFLFVSSLPYSFN